MVAPVVEDDLGTGVSSVDAGCEIAITQSSYTDVKKMEDVPCCFFASELCGGEDTIKTLVQSFNLAVFYDNEGIIYVAAPHLWSDGLNNSFF
ncbi:hypothetical protein SprV_0301295700 [Sparganum proliferum]